jgi:hypothetical protein
MVPPRALLVGYDGLTDVGLPAGRAGLGSVCAVIMRERFTQSARRIGRDQNGSRGAKML